MVLSPRLLPAVGLTYAIYLAGQKLSYVYQYCIAFRSEAGGTSKWYINSREIAIVPRESCPIHFNDILRALFLKLFIPSIMPSQQNSIQYGRRLIPHIIDDFAESEPEREAFQVPRSSDPKDGWRAITWGGYANAVNHVARRIIDICGEPEKDAFPTIAYIGPNDARYVVRTPVVPGTN